LTALAFSLKRRQLPVTVPVGAQDVRQDYRVWPARIGELERGQLRNDDLATAYRTWLSAA